MVPQGSDHGTDCFNRAPPPPFSDPHLSQGLTPVTSADGRWLAGESILGGILIIAASVGDGTHCHCSLVPREGFWVSHLPKLLWPLLGSLFFLSLKNSHCALGQTIGDTQPKWRWDYREMGVPVRRDYVINTGQKK